MRAIAKWRKSSHSGNNGGECVEVADLHRAVAVRDSKNPAGPALIFSVEEWRSFTGRARTSAYDV